MYIPGKSGVSLIQQYRQIERSGKLKLPDTIQWAEIENPPPGFEVIWDAFLDLSSSRQSGFGPSPLSLLELQAWQELTGVVLTAFEVDAIRRVDRVWLKVVSEKNKQDAGSGPTHHRSK